MDAPNLKQQIKVMFANLSRCKSVGMPGINSLSLDLSKIIEKAKAQKTKTEVASISSKIISSFASAAIDMWHRSVHSFIISASLTRTSTLWASVSGYYASHYAIRALAHLFGYYNHYSGKRIIEIDIPSRVCRILKKKCNDREHRFYWRIVKNSSLFRGDPLFTNNNEFVQYSDSGHRNRANYVDHLDRFIDFQILDEPYLKERIKKIAEVDLSNIQIPDKYMYPDLDNVQLVAYHRMIKFRTFLDEVLGGTNRYWLYHRKPDWCSGYLDFQIIEPKYIEAYRTHV